MIDRYIELLDSALCIDDISVKCGRSLLWLSDMAHKIAAFHFFVMVLANYHASALV